MTNATVDAAAETLARRLLQEIPPSRDVPRAAFDRLPTPVARLLSARLDARADREAALPATPWIDRDHAATREAGAAWREAAREAARIPANEWEEMLAETARLAVAHLVQPAETLAAYAFQGEPAPLPTPLVLGRLQAFGPYPYLSEISERYVEKKGLGHIDRDGFERLLHRIDSRMVEGFGAADWIALLDPLFDLAQDTLPAELLHQAFEARWQGGLVADLDGDAITREALHAHLNAALASPYRERAEMAAAPPEAAQDPQPRETPTPEPEPIRPEHADEPSVIEPSRPEAPIIGSKFNAPEDTAPDDSDVLGPARPVEIVAPMEPMEPFATAGSSITDAVVTETMEAAESGDEPLWKRLANGTGAPSAPASTAESDVTPLWAQFSPDAAPSTQATNTPPLSASELTLRTDASLPDLEASVLGATDTDRRSWYTQELFTGNDADYRETLVRLDAARSWTEATDIIARDVFRKHSVNIYSDPAVTFTDAVEAQMEARQTERRG